MLSEKYRPDAWEKMVGNDEARKKLVAWLAKWKKGSKAALLVGPPGTGKTTSVHLLAAKLGMNLVELNASDARTREKMSKRVGEVISSTSLFGEKSLIFLDEVDGLAGRSDYGAVDFIKETVRGSENPVVMAANNPDSDEVRRLASVCALIEFRPPPVSEVLVFLRRVADKERVEVEDGRLFAIAEASRGDLRYALNALQGGTTGSKDEEMTAAQSVNSFFEAPDRDAALKALRAYPGQPRDKVRDIFVSVVKARLPPSKRADAMKALSRADLLMGRIMSGKDWRLLRYLDQMLATDLKDALAGEGVKYTMDGVPWMLQLRIWNDSKKIKEISGRAGRRLGISRKGALVEDFPFMMRLASSKEFRAALVKSLDLDETFQNFIAKEAVRASGPRHSDQR